MNIYLLFFVTSLAMAQSLPSVGWVSTDQQLRRLVGLPGSTRADEPLATYRQVQVAPGGRVALVEDGVGSSLVSLTDEGPVMLAKLAATPDRAAFSEDGVSSALLFGTRLEVRNGGRMVWGSEFGEALDLAVSSRGLVAVRLADGTVRLVTESGLGPVVYQGADLGPLRFRGEGALLVADRAAGRLLSIERLTETPAVRVLLSEAADDYAGSADGRRIYLLRRGEEQATMAVLDLESGQVVREVTAGLQAARLHRLGAGDLFLLAAPTEDGPGWMWHGAEGRVTFLPALKMEWEN